MVVANEPPSPHRLHALSVLGLWLPSKEKDTVNTMGAGFQD
jgi:hypothetical protein